ncbi:MAG TPA: hypothetical protein DHW17_01865 [Nitrospina sp.]|nr:hypothetical protein [Nitrospina sp.]
MKHINFQGRIFIVRKLRAGTRKLLKFLLITILYHAFDEVKKAWHANGIIQIDLSNILSHYVKPKMEMPSNKRFFAFSQDIRVCELLQRKLLDK